MSRGGKKIILWECVVAVVVLGTAPFVGMQLISLSNILHDAFASKIFLFLRVPRVIAAFFAGGGLALCGMVFQAMFRNPLAEPFTLGISSGAAFGAAAMIIFNVAGTMLGVPWITVGAFTGAITSVALVGALSGLQKAATGLTMLLAGIAVSFMFSSLLMLLQYMSSMSQSFQIIRWLMGGIEIYGYQPLLSLISLEGVGIIAIVLALPWLDHLITGEDLAHTRGVNVVRAKRVLLIATSLVVGSIVAVCGPIGFIGLMVPHFCRMLVGASHRTLGPVSFIAGGVGLVVCDTISRVIIAPAEVPVGVITALLGGPFFLWVLFGKGRQGIGNYF
ncbi:MAG: iron ABC transporter permease [Chitinivibrionales bacterium]|nr:iron ABC transporter permease [Chitinivibrionales bacterium]